MGVEAWERKEHRGGERKEARKSKEERRETEGVREGREGFHHGGKEGEEGRDNKRVLPLGDGRTLTRKRERKGVLSAERGRCDELAGRGVNKAQRNPPTLSYDLLHLPSLPIIPSLPITPLHVPLS